MHRCKYKECQQGLGFSSLFSSKARARAEKKVIGYAALLSFETFLDREQNPGLNINVMEHAVTFFRQLGERRIIPLIWVPEGYRPHKSTNTHLGGP